MDNNYFLSHSIHRLIEAMLTHYKNHNIPENSPIISLLAELRNRLDLGSSHFTSTELNNLVESLKVIHQSGSITNEALLPIILFMINKPTQQNFTETALIASQQLPSIPEKTPIEKSSPTKLVYEKIAPKNTKSVPVIFSSSGTNSIFFPRMKNHLYATIWLLLGFSALIFTAYAHPVICHKIEKGLSNQSAMLARSISINVNEPAVTEFEDSNNGNNKLTIANMQKIPAKISSTNAGIDEVYVPLYTNLYYFFSSIPILLAGIACIIIGIIYMKITIKNSKYE